MITSLYQSLCNMETNIADRVALRWYDEEKQGVAEVHYAQYAQDLRRFVAFLRESMATCAASVWRSWPATATSMSSACTARSLPEPWLCR